MKRSQKMIRNKVTYGGRRKARQSQSLESTEKLRSSLIESSIKAGERSLIMRELNYNGKICSPRYISNITPSPPLLHPSLHFLRYLQARPRSIPAPPPSLPPLKSHSLRQEFLYE